MPRVTVLMAVRNGQETVGEAVDSILAQTFTDFEFVIIDDGSTDGTAAVLSSFDDLRLTILANGRHLGLPRTLNRGLAMTGSEYVARQDADDRSAPHRLARQVEVMDARPEVAVVGAWYRKIDLEGTVIALEKLPTDALNLRWHLLFYTPFVHTAAVLRRSVLDLVGGYDESLGYAEDYDLWCRIARRFELANVGDYLVDYRVSPTSMTSTYGMSVVREPAQIARAYLEDLYEGSPTPADAQLDAISALLFRPHLLRSADEGALAAWAALAHHDAFCRFYGITGVARARAHTRLRQQLARRLGRLVVAELRHGRVSSAGRLVAGAARLGVGRAHPE